MLVDHRAHGSRPLIHPVEHHAVPALPYDPEEEKDGGVPEGPAGTGTALSRSGTPCGGAPRQIEAQNMATRGDEKSRWSVSSATVGQTGQNSEPSAPC